MARVDFKVYKNGDVLVSNNSSLTKDEIEEKTIGSGLEIVTHIIYETEDEDREPALNVLLGCHEMEWQGDLSTLEDIVSTIWKAGVEHGRSQKS